VSRRVVVLGSTGSIGIQALEVAAQSPGVEVVGLSAASNWEQLVAQALETGARRIALADPAAAERARGEWDGEVLEGPEGLTELIVSSGADMVLNALVGSAGLGPTITTLAEGIDLALANKESLVVGGELVMSLAEGS
jgi:1-deoxy-D-xylulose-5-phosphate reductoisomerase